MTTTRIQRCEHCHEVYSYHPRCYGMMPIYNDPHYCSACAEVIAKALGKVKVLFYKKFVPTDEYTKDQLIKAQEDRCKQPGSLRLCRIIPGLFKIPICGVQVMSKPVGLAYALRVQYGTDRAECEIEDTIKPKEKIEEKQSEPQQEATIDHQRSVCEIMDDPTTGERIYYMARWWTSEPDKVEMSKEIWWDVVNKKIADCQKEYKGK